MPASLSSLIDAPVGRLAGALAAADESSRRCLPERPGSTGIRSLVLRAWDLASRETDRRSGHPATPSAPNAALPIFRKTDSYVPQLKIIKGVRPVYHPGSRYLIYQDS